MDGPSPRPGATAEDDGVVMFSGIDGGRERGFLMIYDAATMELLYHATAPKKTLFGIHSKFYPFDVGCSTMDGDCTPPPATVPGEKAAASMDIRGHSILAALAFIFIVLSY